MYLAIKKDVTICGSEVLIACHCSKGMTKCGDTVTAGYCDAVERPHQ